MFNFMTMTNNDKDPLSEVVKRAVPHLFNQTQFVPIWVAIPTYFIRITTSFMWIFSDVFILVISIGLSTQFQLFNDELVETQPVIFVTYHAYFLSTKM